MKKLAICIPTYNRSRLLDRLLNSIAFFSDVVVSICDDGSNDDTLQIVKKHQLRIDIRYVFQKNKGRASALRKSILNSKAEFVMIVDSDDYFEKNGIKIILDSIKNNPSIKFFVFPIKVFKNACLNLVSLKGISKINYINLRSDYKIKHDLQEVIQQKLILTVMYDEPKNIRRIPTSYLWFKASEQVDCLPVNSFSVKIKEYMQDGMSANLLPLKVRYPKYLVYLYKIAIEHNRFRFLFSKYKYTILFYRYSFHYKSFKLLKYRHFLFLLIGYMYATFDILKLSIFYKK